MNRLTALWKKDPGLVVSGGAHLLVLAFLLANVSPAPPVDDTQEAVAVEMVTTSELNQVMQGEETAKPLPTPQRRVDKVAAVEEHNPAPPLAEARKDTPPPPSPDKPNDDPGQDTKPAQAAAASPPPPPAPPVRPAEPPVPTPPVPTPPMPPIQPPEAAAPPTPPERPVEKAEAPAPTPAPTPPPRPEPVKPPPPPEAEAIEPTPPPRPKIEPPKVEPPKVQDAKEQPKPPPRPEPRKVAKPVPVPHPREVKEAKVVPPPPPRPEPPKPEPVKPPVKSEPSALDRVARLLDTLKPEVLKSDTPKPTSAPSKPRSGNESKEAPRDSFDPSKISALLDHDAPQHKASTGRALTQVASLGAANGHAEKMSPSMMAQLDGWMIDHYRGCWSYFGLGATQDYVPEVRVRLAQDGSLIGQPALINPPRDPNLKSLADSAIRAVNRCNPMEMPERFKPFYQSWRDRTVRFDPKEMS